ncbi:MAG: hypothetical protein WD688_20980 [Candidatus Binatia bacterium]
MLFVSIGLILVTMVGCAAQRSSAEQSQEPRQQRKESQAMGKMSMGKMSMDEMMKDCKEHHQSAVKSIDQMTKMMDGAKQSNDPAKMRSALDQSQKQLSEIKEHMTMCGNMMSMMEKMQGMGGMMRMMKMMDQCSAMMESAKADSGEPQQGQKQ